MSRKKRVKLGAKIEAAYSLQYQKAVLSLIAFFLFEENNQYIQKYIGYFS